jgi:hypothetical protein
MKWKYIGKKYYSGTGIKWMIQNKKRENVSCDRCGNIANGIKLEKLLFMTVSIPLCKVHIAEDYIKGADIRAPHLDYSDLKQERQEYLDKDTTK